MVWFWVWVFSLIGGAWHFVTLDGQRRRLSRRCNELEQSIEVSIEDSQFENRLRRSHEAKVESMEKTVKELQAQIGGQNMIIEGFKGTVSRRDSEKQKLIDTGTRREAVIEGLKSELAESRNASQRMTERLNGAERELAAQRKSAKWMVDVKTDLEKQLSAAKALLEGVKVGERELLVVQPQGKAPVEAMEALKAACGDMPGKLVVLDNLNAWKATPIGSHAVEVDPSEFIDAYCGIPAGTGHSCKGCGAPREPSTPTQPKQLNSVIRQ